MATQKSSFWLTPKGLAALGLIGAASYFLLVEHRQHVWQFLPFLILLACPFMHLFMHGGHGGHGGSHQHLEESHQHEGDPPMHTKAIGTKALAAATASVATIAHNRKYQTRQASTHAWYV